MTANDNSMAILQGHLPNAPDEVLDVWLKPYVDLLGWPPCSEIHTIPGGRWRGILSNRSVAFWAQVRWRREDGPVEFNDLDEASQQALFGLRDAHIYRISNAYTEITDGRERLNGIMSYVIKHGCIPSALIFLDTGSRLSVIDGHHRLVAYFLNRDIHFRKTLPAGVASFSSIARKWIGKYQMGSER